MAFYPKSSKPLEDPTHKNLKSLYIEDIEVGEFVDENKNLGSWDDMRQIGGVQLLNGWAIHPDAKHPGEKVLIVDKKKKILATSSVFDARQDVAKHLGDKNLENVG